MATLALGTGGGLAGAELGSLLLAGPTFGLSAAAAAAVGASIGVSTGATAGGVIDKMLIEPAIFGNKEPGSGLTLDDLRLQTASEGSAVKFLIGEANRIAGTVIWLGSFQTLAGGDDTTSGGKGAGNPSTAAYTVSIAIGLCEGPIESVDVVWADSKMIYNGKQTSLNDAYAPVVTGSLVGSGSGTSYGYVVSSNHPGSAPYLSNEVVVSGPSPLSSSGYVKLQWDSVQPIQKVEPNGNFNGYNVYGRTVGGEKFILTIPPATVNPDGSLTSQTGPTDPATGQPRWSQTNGVVTFIDAGSLAPSNVALPTKAPSTDTRYKQITFHLGTQTQQPDAYLEAAIGAGQSPAYTNIAYIVIQGLDLTDWGNRIPQFTALVRQHTGTTAQYAVNRLLSRSELDPSHWDTTQLTDSTNTILGYPLAGPQGLDKTLDPLLTFFNLVTSEINGVLSFFNRSTPTTVTVIPASQLGVHEGSDGQVTRLVKVTDQADYDLPSNVEVVFIDPTRDYQQSSMIEKKILGGGGATNTVNLPLTISALQARKLGRRVLWGAWAERQSVSFALPPAYLYLQEGDLVIVPIAGVNTPVRITTLDIGYNLLIQVEGVVEQSQILYPPANADDGSVTVDTPYNPQAVILILMDIPSLRDDEIDVIGLYWCCCPASNSGKFKGAHLYSSTTGGTWFDVSDVNAAGYIGYSNSALPAPPNAILPVAPNTNITVRDDTNEVTVTMLNGTLSSASTDDVQAGANLCLLGNEIIAFETATLVGVNQYQLQNIWRGLRDTMDTAKTSTHAINDQFVLLSGRIGIKMIPHERKSIGTSLQYKAVPVGSTFDPSDPTAFVAYAAATIPFRPLTFGPGTLPASYASTDGVDPSLVGTTPQTTDIAVAWQRRSVEQQNTFDWTPTDQTNDWPPETYVVTVFELTNGAQGTQLGSAHTVFGRETFYYTTLEQNTDGHTVGNCVWVEVYQQGNISKGNLVAGPICPTNTSPTPYPNPVQVPYTFDSGDVKETNDGGSKLVYVSSTQRVSIPTNSTVVYFQGSADDETVLVQSSGNGVSAIYGSDSTTIETTVAQGLPIFCATVGQYNSPQLWTDGSHSVSMPAYTQPADQYTQLHTAGFTAIQQTSVPSVGDCWGVSVSVLKAIGVLDNSGNLDLTWATCPNGGGRFQVFGLYYQ